MKKKYLAYVLSASLVLTCSVTTHAQIPVTDGASIATALINQIETMAQWATQIKAMADQYNTLKQQYAQAQEQFKSMNGTRALGMILNNPNIKFASTGDWTQVMNGFKSGSAFTSYRKQFPTNPNYPKSNNLYDTIAAQRAGMTEYFKKSNDRILQTELLMQQINAATDPAAKADLQNRLTSEGNAIEANAQMFEVIKQKYQDDLDAASEAASSEWSCKEFKRSNC